MGVWFALASLAAERMRAGRWEPRYRLIRDGLSGESPRAVEAVGIRLVGYSDLDGRPGFKLALHEVGGQRFLYLGHLWDNGWTVVDVTDASKPRPLAYIEGPPNTWTLQVQAADGLLLTSMEHPPEEWGFESAKANFEGVAIFDIGADPICPPLLGEFRTGGTGTHRNFYVGGRFAYLAANPQGFKGHLLVVLDVDDPSDPKEISRWWVPGQHVAGGEVPEHEYYLHGPAFVTGDLAYLGYGGAGLVILDVTDPEAPKQLGGLEFRGFGSVLGCHSVVPIPGSSLVAANSEAIDEDGNEGYNYCFIVDVADPSRPVVIGSVPQPVPQSGTGLRSYFAKGGRFGPHNQHHPDNGLVYRGADLLFMTYFNAGLRVFDITEPRAPIEVGCYVAEKPIRRFGVMPQQLETQFEDVLVDRRGNIFCTDKNWGLFVFRADALDERM